MLLDDGRASGIEEIYAEEWYHGIWEKFFYFYCMEIGLHSLTIETALVKIALWQTRWENTGTWTTDTEIQMWEVVNFKISFSWTVQTMNSYDSVSKLCWEGKNYMYSLGHYIWSAKLKLYKIIVEKSIFETKHKDPKHGKKQLEFRKLTMSGPLLQFIIIWVTLCNSSVLQN